MIKSRYLLAIEAVIFGLPAVAFLIWATRETSILLRFFITDGVARQNESSASFLFMAPLLIALGIFLLFILGRLVVQTLRRRPFQFGLIFWSAFSLGLFVGAYMYLVVNSKLAFFVVVPLYALCAHATYIQLHERNEPQGA